MKKVTSMTVFNDAIGMRMSVTFSEIDETGKVTADNKRFDRVITDSTALKNVQKMMEFAQDLLDAGV